MTSKPRRDNEAITAISEAVYRLELGPASVRSMIVADKDDGAKLRRRAASRNAMTVRYLTALGLPIPTLDSADEVIAGLFGD